MRRDWRHGGTAHGPGGDGATRTRPSATTRSLALAGRLAERFGTEVETIDPPPPRRPRPAAATRGSLPAALAAWCSTATVDRAGHTYGKSYRDIVRAVHGDLPDPPDVVAFPPTEADVVAVLDWCASAGVAAIPYGGGSSVVGGVECAVGDGVRRCGLDRPRRARPRARGRPGLAGGPHPGRRARPGAGGPAPPARLHAAPLPAVVRALDARRLAGHPLRRPLRQRVHPHRRPRRVDARRHADRHQRVPPPARLRRRTVARPPVPRVGGQPRHHHRGLDAGPGPAAVAGVGRGRVRRATPTAWPRPGPIAQSALFPTNCRLLDGTEAAISAGTSGMAALLVLGFESADHPVERLDGPGRRAVPRPRRRRPGRRPADPTTTAAAARTRRRRRRLVAVGVPAGAVPAQRARALRDDPGDVRDGLHVGRVRRAARRRHRRGRGRRRSGSAAAAG